MQAIVVISWLSALPMAQAAKTFVVHWKSTFDSSSSYLFVDSDGNPLSQGTSTNQDGSLVVLGYFSESTSSNLFQGEFVPLTMGTSIGDSSYGSGMQHGMFSFSTKFVMGSQAVTIYPNRPATYDVNASHVIETNAPPNGTYLAIRFYDQSVISNSAKYNTVASPNWKWTGASSGIPTNEYFKAIGDSGSGNTSSSDYVYGNTFENPSFPYQTAIAFSFDLGVTVQGPGTVSPVDVNGTYEYGTNVAISATVTDANYEFAGWSGGGTADANASVTTVSMTQDRNLTAVFEPKEYTLTVLVNDGSKGSASGSGTFPYGTVPTITATPVTGHEFTGWSGSGVLDANDASTTVTLDQDLTVTANFALKQYNLEVNATQGGTAATDTGPYYHFGEYDLNATAAVGYTFTEWTGEVDNVDDVNSSSTSITMLADANVTASFTMNSYLLTVNSTAGGDANGTGTYLHNQLVSVTATPSTGFKFTGWTGDVGSLGDANAASTTVNMSTAGTNLSITANFLPQDLDLAVTATEGGDANGTGIYQYNDNVLIVATPLTGWSFDYWSGDVSVLSSTDNASVTATMVTDANVTANFTRKQYTLTVLSGAGGDANGSGAFTFESNATVSASPNPPAGYEFSHWSGDVSTMVNVNSSTTTLAIPASDVTVTANFSALPYIVRLSVNGDVNGTVGFEGDANGSLSVTATYFYDDNVSILGFPNGTDAGAPKRGYYLDQWSWVTNAGSGTTSENPYRFVLSGDLNATATFLPIPPDSFLITLDKNLSAAGTLYVANGGYYDEDTSFPITTTTNDGYTFLAWTSAEISSFSPGDFNSTATVGLDQNSTATAQFLQNEYFLELTSTADGTVSEGGASHRYGDSADANATPDSIHDFNQWTIDKTMDYSVTVGSKSHDANKSVFMVKGQERPSLTFIRGFTYSLEVNGSHEFQFSTDPNGGGDFSGEFLTGVTNSRATGGATISIAVDDSTPDTLYYYSGSTPGMGSPIKVITMTDSEILPFPTQSSTNVAMVADFSLQATYSLKTYDLTVNASTGGSAEANATGPHEHGSIVTISATPDVGYDFVSWSGSGITDANATTTTVTMTQAQSVTANFKIKTYSLTLASDSSGGSVRTSDNEYLYEHGATATILATPSEGYSFIEWTGDSTSVERNATVYMDGNKTITGTFQANIHNLFITQTTKNADGSSNENSALGGTYFAGSNFAHGAIASLVATANPGFEFVEWETNGTIELDVAVSNGVYAIKGQSRPTLILVRGNVYNFNLDGGTTTGQPLYFSTSDGGGGTLSGLHDANVTNSNADSGTITFAPDASTPDTLYYYSSATAGMGNAISVVDAASIDLGQFSSTSTSTNVTMVADRSYHAVFQRKSYEVDYAPYPQTAGSISFATYDGSSKVEHGSTITATATPAEGYVFVSWAGSGLTPAQQVQSTLALTITSDQTITANFAKEGNVTLILNVSPDVAGSAAGAGTYTYTPALPIYAEANDGYEFIGWQGGSGFVDDLNNSRTTLSLIDDLTLTALFELVPSAANEPKARPLEAIYDGWDWWHSDWFGSYWYVSGNNWVFHHQLGWCYMIVQSDDSVWLWSEIMENWIWTNPTLFPFIFDYPNAEWLWFNTTQSIGLSGQRLFYRYSTGKWETR